MMKNIWENLEDIKVKLDKSRILLCLDFDGTLVPIQEHPQEVFLSETNRALLKQLLATRQVQIVVVSGRSLTDVRYRVGLEGIIYAGNHGFEIEGDDLYWDDLVPMPLQDSIDSLKGQLSKKLSDVPGVWVEYKKSTLSVHYRQVQEEVQSWVKTVVENICQPYLERDIVVLRTGKKVFEIRPSIDWNKGKAVIWILKQEQLKYSGQKMEVIYIGDDATDQDAFEALGPESITIAVGSVDLKANYFLKNTEDVTKFLQYLFEEKEAKI